MDYSLILRIIKDFTVSLWIGVSVFSTTFIISLLIGTAGNHPVLGPLEVLYAVGINIVALSLLLALTKELVTRVDASIATTKLVKRRRLIGATLREQLVSAPQPVKQRVPVQ
ncbi:MAG: hypothetical protein ABIQ64_04110 [Candidatus Saccharimonadales bacterium]